MEYWANVLLIKLPGSLKLYHKNDHPLFKTSSSIFKLPCLSPVRTQILILASDKLVTVQKTKIIESNPMASHQVEGEKVETVTDFIFLAPKSLETVTAALKLKDACSLKGKL